MQLNYVQSRTSVAQNRIPAGSFIASRRLSAVVRPTPLTLGPKDTLKLTFQIVEKEEGKGVHPHQTFLRFYDAKSGEEGIQPVRVTASGKAKFELVSPISPSQL